MKIQNKLFIVIISFSFFLISTTVLMVQWSIDKGMIEYINTREANALEPVIEAIGKQYQHNGSWKYIEGNHQLFIQLLDTNIDKSEFFPKPPRGRQRLDKDRRFDNRPPKRDDEINSEPNPERFKGPRRSPHPDSFAILDSDKHYVVGDYPESKEYSFLPIESDEGNVGYFAVSKKSELTEDYDLDFISQQQSTIWWLALLIMGLVVIVTIPLARNLVQPIKKLAGGMHKLTQGDYQQKIILNRKDELGELSRDFNELAQTLDANETARKRWLANISHELRTPVAILKGELEAMIDGIRPLSIDNVQSAHQEVKHLGKLIDDLHMLTSTDIGGMTYRKTQLNLVGYLEGEQQKYQSYLFESDLVFSVDLPSQQLMILADTTRLSQLFDNLINNCVKYAKGGTKVCMSLHAVPQHKVKLIIEDDGAGVDDSHLSHLFEHLYRVDDSRNRLLGGAGLGLSICAQIVKGHEGNISASKSSLGGLAITIELPMC